MEEDSEKLSNVHSSADKNLQQLIDSPPTTYLLISKEAMHSKEENQADDNCIQSISLINTSQVHIIKDDSTEDDVTDEFLNLVKGINLEEEEIAKNDAEEKVLAGGSCPDDRVSFSGEYMLKDATLVEDGNNEEIDGCCQSTAVGNTSLKNMESECTWQEKHVAANCYLENESVNLHSEEHITKDDMPEVDVIIDDFTEDLSLGSFSQNLMKEVASEEEAAVLSTSLEGIKEESEGTDRSLEGILTDNQLQQRIGKKKGTNICLGKKSVSSSLQQHVEKDNSNGVDKASGFLKNASLDNSLHEYTSNNVISLGGSSKEILASNDCVDGIMVDSRSKKHITKNSFSGNKTFHYQKGKCSNHISVRSTFRCKRYGKVGETKVKKSLTEDVSGKHISKDLPMVSNDSSKEYKDTLKVDLEEYRILTNDNLDDKESSKPTQSSVAYKCHSQNIMETPVRCNVNHHSIRGQNESRKPFIVLRNKHKSFEVHNSFSHSMRGMNHDKSFMEQNIIHKSLSWCSTQHSFKQHHVSRSFRGQSSAQKSSLEMNNYQHFRGWTSIQNPLRGRGFTNHSFRCHSAARHSVSGKGFVNHPYEGGFHVKGLPLENFTIRKKNALEEEISNGDVTSQNNEILLEYGESQDNEYNTNTNENNIATVPNSFTESIVEQITDEEKLKTKCAFSINEKVISTDFTETKARPPWISFSELSMLLSTAINLYLQSLLKRNIATDCIFSTLYDVVELVEKTIKGYQIYCRIKRSSSLQSSSNLTSQTAEIIQSFRGILLLQRKRMMEAVEISQAELKSAKLYALYSEQEIPEVCNGIRRKVMEQLERVQWLNNDLKLEKYFSEISISYPYQKHEELFDILLRDLEMIKTHIKSIKPGDSFAHKYPTNCYNESSGNATFNMPLLEQWFVIKQHLEDLQG